MPVIYTAVKRFAPACRDDWQEFIDWSGLTQLRAVVSLDGILCPTIFEELEDEDWQHNMHKDFMVHFFHDLDYVVGRAAGEDQVNILAVIQEPTPAELASFTDPRFEFVGFDLLEQFGGDVSALVNCGGFPEAFSPDDLSDCGLLTDHAKALRVQKLLRSKYPDSHDADCDVWAIWQMKRGAGELKNEG